MAISIQHSPSRGRTRTLYSNDGGATWCVDRECKIPFREPKMPEVNLSDSLLVVGIVVSILGFVAAVVFL